MQERTGDLRSLKCHEQGLIAYQRSVIAIPQLVHPVHAANEDKNDRQEQETEEDFDSGPQRARTGLSLVAHHVVGKQSHKNNQGNNLKDETGHGDFDAALVASASLCRGQRAAGGLEHQGHDITRDEDPYEEPGPESRYRAIEIVDALQQDEKSVSSLSKDHKKEGLSLTFLTVVHRLQSSRIQVRW